MSGARRRWVSVRALAIGFSLALSVGPLKLDAQARAGDGQAERGAPGGTVIYDNVSVLDGTGGALRPGQSIVVREGRIVQVTDRAEISADRYEGAEVVDGSGLFAIPGLIESHTHLATVANRERAAFLLNRYIYAGVTTVRDMAGDARSLADLQRAALIGEIPAPDIHYSALIAGPTFYTDPRTVSSTMGEAPGLVPWTQTVEESTDLSELVTIARGTWATGVKTYAAIEGPLLAEIASEARRQGIPVWSHTHVGPARPLEVARAGVTSMSHVCSLAAAAIPDAVYEEGQTGARSGFVDVDLESPAIDEVLGEMREHGTVLDATLRIVVAAEARGAQPPTPPPTAEREGPPTGPQDVRRRGVRGRCDAEGAVALTRRAYEAGVRIAAGTDGMTPPADEWPALFDELEYLHERVGMPMTDVIRAATLHGAIALGLEDRIGTVETGKYANLVFLDEDPTSGVESLRSVAYTVKRGRRYDRSDFVLGTPPGRPGGR